MQSENARSDIIQAREIADLYLEARRLDSLSRVYAQAATSRRRDAFARQKLRNARQVGSGVTLSITVPDKTTPETYYDEDDEPYLDEDEYYYEPEGEEEGDDDEENEGEGVNGTLGSDVAQYPAASTNAGVTPEIFERAPPIRSGTRMSSDPMRSLAPKQPDNSKNVKDKMDRKGRDDAKGLI